MWIGVFHTSSERNSTMAKGNNSQKNDKKNKKVKKESKALDTKSSTKK